MFNQPLDFFPHIYVFVYLAFDVMAGYGGYFHPTRTAWQTV